MPRRTASEQRSTRASSPSPGDYRGKRDPGRSGEPRGGRAPRAAAAGPGLRTDEVSVGNVTVQLSNAGKVLFPGDGITKGDLVAHYQLVADLMLPLLRDRPVSMSRYPDGIDAEGIVQKNAPSYFPGWITRAKVRKQGGWLRQVVCDKPATLVYLANLACIEVHAVLSKLGRIDEPDQLIFDLDPPDDSSFGDVRLAALKLRDLLEDELGLATYIKTTGGAGLHVHVPLNARKDFDSVRAFARGVARLLAVRNPGLVTTEQRKDKRGTLVYMDIMRNAYAQTAVAPYAVRARPGAPVATPLSWHELANGQLAPGQFTVRTLPGRIGPAGQDSPWADMARRRFGLARPLRILQRLTA